MNQYALGPSLIFGIATLQGIFLVGNLLFLKKGNRTANLVLMVLLLVISLLVFQNFIGWSGYYVFIPHIIFLFYPLNGVVGPLFFLYILFLIKSKCSFKWHDLVHLAGILYLIHQHWFFLSLTAAQKIGFAEYVYFQEHFIPESDFVFLILLKLYTLIYSLMGMVYLHRKHLECKALSSDHDAKNIYKFKWVAYSFTGFTMMSMLMLALCFILHISIWRLEIYLHAINSLFIMAMSVITIQQPERLFFVLNTQLEKAKKNLASGASIVESLKELMIETKPYLNPELKLHDLAYLANVPAHTVSDQINQKLGVNFYDFVNRYRVEEFKRRAVSNEFKHLTLLAIAHDVGFNSKASFNRIFKKQTGLTPRQYLSIDKDSTSQVESKRS